MTEAEKLAAALSRLLAVVLLFADSGAGVNYKQLRAAIQNAQAALDEYAAQGKEKTP